MTTVGIRELRQNLSAYLREVAEGKSIQVTDHGRPVAVLGPVPAEQSEWDRLIAEGTMRPPQGDLLALGPPPEDIEWTGSLTEALDEIREDSVE
ncbi:MAG: type II toxin-antitoxin system prevent-host-death family antitoxin [Thermoleophilaceae bacterium]|nr:type II toxin-antitoxin system prevent-host-death family antitoxin [Thermoleophilaceae bacterium]